MELPNYVYVLTINCDRADGGLIILTTSSSKHFLDIFVISLLTATAISSRNVCWFYLSNKVVFRINISVFITVLYTQRGESHSDYKAIW